jgi:hypothetical protein
MARVNNSETIAQLRKVGGLSSVEMQTPSVDSRTIIPVMETNPTILHNIDIVRFIGTSSSTASITAYTTPTNQDFYMTGCSLSMVKDAANDGATANIAIGCFVGGVVRYPLVIATLTLTAQSQTVAISFQKPIKVDRNTAITVACGTFTAGSRRVEGTINGYIDEASNT